MLGNRPQAGSGCAWFLCPSAGAPRPDAAQPAPMGSRLCASPFLTPRASKASLPPSISPAQTSPPIAGPRIQARNRREPRQLHPRTRHRACRPPPSPQMLLVASAVGIYGNRGDELIDETSPLGTGFLAELLPALGGSRQARRRCRHPRPPSPLRCRSRPRRGRSGPDSPPLPPRSGRPARQRTSVHELDLAPRTLWPPSCFSSNHPPSPAPFNFTAPNPVTNEQFTAYSPRQLHRPAFLSVPAFALRLAFGEMADEMLLSRRPRLPRQARRRRFPVLPPQPRPRPPCFAPLNKGTTLILPPPAVTYSRSATALS